MTISLPARPIIIDSNEATRKPLVFNIPNELLCPHTEAFYVGDYSLLGLENFTVVRFLRISFPILFLFQLSVFPLELDLCFAE